jgi:opacity protein-like surface antigen
MAVLTILAAPLAAQGSVPPTLQTAHFGIGYTANLPDAQVGGGAYVLLPRWGGIGLYLDAKFGISGPETERGYDGSVTAVEIEDDLGGTFVREDATWWSANIALMRPLSPYFTLYAGGGVAHLSSYRLYNVDRELDVGVGGLVWARDTRGNTYKPNLMIGMITRLTSRVSAHFGYETQPDGVTVGLSLRLPRW